MKYLCTLTLILTSWGVMYGQQGNFQQKLESAKIGIITERLNLSSEQAQQFWPLYNELSIKRKDLNVEMAKARLDLTHSNMNDDKANNMIALYFQNRRKQVDLHEQYIAKFKQVITPTQVVKLITVEEEFNKMILQKLRERQQNRRLGGN